MKDQQLSPEGALFLVTEHFPQRTVWRVSVILLVFNPPNFGVEGAPSELWLVNPHQPRSQSLQAPRAA